MLQWGLQTVLFILFVVMHNTWQTKTQGTLVLFCYAKKNNPGDCPNLTIGARTTH